MGNYANVLLFLTQNEVQHEGSQDKDGQKCRISCPDIADPGHAVTF